LEEQQDFLAASAFSLLQQDFLLLSSQEEPQEEAQEDSFGAALGPQPPQPAVAVAAAKTISTGMSNVFIG
jgi:hypothetical protein